MERAHNIVISITAYNNQFGIRIEFLSVKCIASSVHFELSQGLADSEWEDYISECEAHIRPTLQLVFILSSAKRLTSEIFRQGWQVPSNKYM